MRFLSPVAIATGPSRVAPFSHPCVIPEYSTLTSSLLRTSENAVMPANGAACSMVVRSIMVPETVEEKSSERKAVRASCALAVTRDRGSSGCVHCHVQYGSRPGETRNWAREFEPCSSASSSNDDLGFPLTLRVEGGQNCPVHKAARSTAAHRSCEAGIRG